MMALKLALVLLWSILAFPAAAQTLSGTVKDGERGERIAKAVVWAEPVGKSTAASPPAEPAVMEQRNLAFVPSVLPILVGMRVIFPNNDKVYHNIYSFSKTNRFNLGLYQPGIAKSVVFDTPGVVKVFCNIHDFMRATIIVLETPYFTMTDQQGTYTLPALAPGSYQLKAWYADRSGTPQQVEMEAGKDLQIDLILQKQE